MAKSRSKEEEKDPPVSDRTDDEKEASAAKLNAETERIKAETRKAKAEAKKAEAEAVEAEIKAKKARDEEGKRLAEDQFYHLYMFDEQVSASSVKNCIKKLSTWSRQEPGCEIEIIFSSPGGSVIDGFVLFDFLRDLSSRGHHITTGTLGMAASMAGILLQAGDTRYAGNQAWLMIHRAAFGAVGQTFEVEDRVKWIKRIEDRIINIFVSRSKLSSQKIKRNWDRKDWWIDADEALEMGLIDEIRGSSVNE